MEAGQAQPLAHGPPGTPVSDLFPLGNSVFGSGPRGPPRPIRAGELTSHSAGSEPNGTPYGPRRDVRENRGRANQSGWLANFIRMRQGDHEAMVSRVTFELEEQTALAVREEELRSEYAIAAEELREELSAEAASILPAPRAAKIYFCTSAT